MPGRMSRCRPLHRLPGGSERSEARPQRGLGRAGPRDWLTIVGPPLSVCPPHPGIDLGRIDTGEIAVLTVALANPGATVVLDDLAARGEADRLGIPKIGGGRLRRGVWGEIHNTGERLPAQVEEVDLLQCEQSHLVSFAPSGTKSSIKVSALPSRPADYSWPSRGRCWPDRRLSAPFSMSAFEVAL